MAVLRQGQHFLAGREGRQDSHSPGSACVAVAELRLLLLDSSAPRLSFREERLCFRATATAAAEQRLTRLSALQYKLRVANLVEFYIFCFYRFCIQEICLETLHGHYSFGESNNFFSDAGR